MFDPIDRFFAKTLLKSLESKEVELFLCYLMHMSLKGHLCLEIINHTIYPDELEEHLKDEVIKGFYALPEQFYNHKSAPLVKKNHLVYLQKNWIYERIIVDKTKELMQNEVSQNIDLVMGVDLLEKTDLLFEQKKAILHVFEHSLTLICGGPGTGKSYTASKLIELFVKSSKVPLEITIAAATGKAVSQLEEKIQVDISFQAKTLHSLLGISQGKNLSFDEVFITSDLIIVDEASMIDVKMFAYLLSSIKKGARLVCIGDPHQLPPVEAGSVFVDLAEKEAIYLQENVRVKNPLLKQFSNALLQADVKEVMQALHRQTISYLDLSKEVCFSYFDRFIPPQESPIDIEKVYQEFAKFRILSCVREGSFGVDTLNQKLFNYYFKQAKSTSYLAIPIIMAQNDPQLELYNGMAGVLLFYQGTKKIYFKIKGKLKEFSSHAIGRYEYGFALSIHKSQGSEFNEVLILVPKGSENFGREILYTAVTRAKEKIQIIGVTSIIEEVIQKKGKKHSGILRSLDELREK